MWLRSIFTVSAYLLQNASQVPFAFSGCKFFASFTSTCSAPLPGPDEFDDVDVMDLVLNLRRFNVPLPLPLW